MNIVRKSLFRLALIAITLFFFLPARSAEQQEVPIIVDILSDSLNIVDQPEGMAARLLMKVAPKEQARHEASGPHPVPGFRVQVFSDNSATARNNSRQREMKVSSRFPQYRVYKRYAAPFWRVRVGDFRGRAEADQAAAAIRRAFPSFAKEIRVVNDRVLVQD